MESFICAFFLVLRYFNGTAIEVWEAHFFRDALQLMLKKALTQASLKRSSQVLGKYKTYLCEVRMNEVIEGLSIPFQVEEYAKCQILLKRCPHSVCCKKVNQK